MSTIKINEQIAFLRKQKGLTQEGLAELLGVSNQAVSKWEAAQCCPDIQLLPKMAKLFGVSVDELLGGEPVPVKPDLSEEDFLSAFQQKLKSLQKEEAFDFAFHMAVGLHSIIFTKFMNQMPAWDPAEAIRHVDVGEWGYSAYATPEKTTVMRHGVLLFSNNQYLGMEEQQLCRITVLLKLFSESDNLKTVVALYRCTVANEEGYASVEQICQESGLDKESVCVCLQGDLQPYLSKKQESNSTMYRLQEMYMSIIPALSLLDFCG